MRRDVERIRGYLELLDAYSLHHFVVWQGHVLADTPEFASFQRTCAAQWTSVEFLVGRLEELMRRNAVPLAVVDGRQLVELAAAPAGGGVGPRELLECVANLDQVAPLLRHLRPHPPGLREKVRAATVIQANARMFLEVRRFGQRRARHRGAIAGQRAVRRFLCRCHALRALAAHHAARNASWERQQRALGDWWDGMAAASKHLRLCDPPLATRQNLQLFPRLSALADPRVHIIYVTTRQMPADVVEYQLRLLATAGVHNAAERLRFVAAENADRLPPHLPLASVVLYSPRCLQRLRAAAAAAAARCIGAAAAAAGPVRRPICVLVPGVAGWHDKALGVALGFPALSADPDASVLLATCSAQKRVFAAADVAAPIGAHDLYDEEDALVALAKLVAGNLDVRRWLFRCERCRGHRGLAYIDASCIAGVEGLRRDRAAVQRAPAGGAGSDAAAAAWHNPDVQLLARAEILKHLRQCLLANAVVCDHEMSPTWPEFLRRFTRAGGVIEAEPREVLGYLTASIFIEPYGGGGGSSVRGLAGRFVPSGGLRAPADLRAESGVAGRRAVRRRGAVAARRGRLRQHRLHRAPRWRGRLPTRRPIVGDGNRAGAE
ncbi:unnamed protein product [Phaeothamnion confervicola]